MEISKPFIMRATEFKIYNNILMKGMCKASTLKTIIQSSGKLRPKCGIKERYFMFMVWNNIIYIILRRFSFLELAELGFQDFSRFVWRNWQADSKCIGWSRIKEGWGHALPAVKTYCKATVIRKTTVIKIVVYIWEYNIVS